MFSLRIVVVFTFWIILYLSTYLSIYLYLCINAGDSFGFNITNRSLSNLITFSNRK